MSKRNLLNVIEDYKRKQEEFRSKVSGILENTDLSQYGVEKRVNEMTASFEVVAKNAHDKAIEILDKGIGVLESKWRANSTGKLLDSNYQIGLANTIKMIEIGAIVNKEDFKNIIEAYKNDFNALATIRNILGNDKDKLELLMLIPLDNREYNLKQLNSLKKNIENSINPYSVKENLSLNFDGMIQFISTRLNENFEIMPW